MIVINLEKAKDITHKKRREARAKEFEPYDHIIMKQIPNNDLKVAEESRQEIRNKYETIQNEIDNSENINDLLLHMKKFEEILKG